MIPDETPVNLKLSPQYDPNQVFGILDEISRMDHGWDGYRAMAFTKEIIDITRELLEEVVIPNCYDILLIPNSNMTISVVVKLKHLRVTVNFLISTSSFATFTMKCRVGDREIIECIKFGQRGFDYANSVLSSLIHQANQRKQQ